MSDQPGAKRQKTDGDETYELVYWPGIPGRGEFIRLLLEEAGASYVDVAKTPQEAVGIITSSVSADNVGDDSNPPVCACPILRHGDLTLNQLPNILLYLAPRLGLGPSEGKAVYHLNGIVLTLIDGFVNELHDTHHPIATSLFYEDQKPEAKKRAKAFREERIPKYLAYAQRTLDAKTSGDGPWLYGGELTYADLVLYQCIDGTTFAFPKTMAEMKKLGKYDGVFKLYETIKERPNISAFLKSDRHLPYSHGIWRYYPELEED